VQEKTVCNESLIFLHACHTDCFGIAVAFHFSRVGNDSGAADLLADLDECCESVDCLRGIVPNEPSLTMDTF
jgi:hypothetical protein